ncbi:MAG: ATP-binding protein [Ignavibacteria bacterium]|nr:ATP-binding protein [Ignavibacteria bacterium]
MSKNLKKETADKLKGLIETYKFSEAQLANKIEISADTLQDILKEQYDNLGSYEWEKTIDFIDEFTGNFYDTELTGIVFRMLNTAYSEKGLIVITSNSGAGKTTAVRRYGMVNSHALYLRVTGVFTKRYLLQKILKALGNPYEGMEIFTMFDSVCKLLQKKNYIIIIDEAERLSVSLIELLRDIYDDGNVSLALIGLHTLRDLLIYGNRKKRDRLVQVTSRIDYQRVVDILKPKDVQKVIEDKLADNLISSKKIEQLSKTYENDGGMRAIIKLCNLIIKLYETNKSKINCIDDELVDAAVQKLNIRKNDR